MRKGDLREPTQVRAANAWTGVAPAGQVRLHAGSGSRGDYCHN